MWLGIRENTVQEVWRIFDSFKEDLLGLVRLFLQFFMKNSDLFVFNNRQPKAGLMTRFKFFSTDIAILFLLVVPIPIKNRLIQKLKL